MASNSKPSDKAMPCRLPTIRKGDVVSTKQQSIIVERVERLGGGKPDASDARLGNGGDRQSSDGNLAYYGRICRKDGLPSRRKTGNHRYIFASLVYRVVRGNDCIWLNPDAPSPRPKGARVGKGKGKND